MTVLDHSCETLWITDAELIRRIGVPEKIAYQALRMLDATPGSGFPKKQKLWGDRRYWPAVKAYFDVTNPLPIGAARATAQTPDSVPAAAPFPLRNSQRRSYG